MFVFSDEKEFVFCYNGVNYRKDESYGGMQRCIKRTERVGVSILTSFF